MFLLGSAAPQAVGWSSVDNVRNSFRQPCIERTLSDRARHSAFMTLRVSALLFPLDGNGAGTPHGRP